MTPFFAPDGFFGAPAFRQRLALAVVQAVALYGLLTWNERPQGWFIDNPAVFDPLFLCAVYLPLMAMLDAGRIAPRAQALWLGGVALALGLIGWHAATRGTQPAYGLFGRLAYPWAFWPVLSGALFIAEALACDSLRTKSWRPPYADHFESAWRHVAQLMMALVFAGLFWGVMLLGRGLLNLIHIYFLRDLIDHRWFYIPATNLALAVALHVADVEPQINRGARDLTLTLLSWLLPLLALLLAVFLAGLPFASLDLLWNTHYAARLLLTAAGLAVFLINCAYQDGGEAWEDSRVKRWAAGLATVELAVLLALAAWALALRVNQYGWSVDRIEAAALIAVGAVYSVFYLAGLFAKPWLKRLEAGNVAAAWLGLALVFVLLTPIADPARLAVASQWARLQSGAVTPDKFDFATLKFDGGRWGAEALAQLAQSQDAATRAEAERTLAMKIRFAAARVAAPLTDEVRLRQIDVFPPGRVLPPDFIAAVTASAAAAQFNSCFNTNARPDLKLRCAAQFILLRPNEPEDILFTEGGNLKLFRKDENGHLRVAATLNGLAFCPEVGAALRGGAATPTPHDLPDLVVAGHRLTLTPTGDACAKKP